MANTILPTSLAADIFAARSRGRDDARKTIASVDHDPEDVMNQPPEPLSVTVERWLCPHCQRENPNKKKAAECCLCVTCNKNLATFATYGGKPDICASCQTRKQRERARNDVRSAQNRVDRARKALADAERDLVRAQTTLAVLAPRPKKPETREGPA